MQNTQRARRTDLHRLLFTMTAVILFVLVGLWGGSPAVAQAADESRRQVVSIVITDSGMELSEGTVQRGAVEFRVRNDASVAYEIEIEGRGIDYDSRDIPAGQTLVVTLNLQSGRYEVEAESEDGPDREWRARLTVRE